MFAIASSLMYEVIPGSRILLPSSVYSCAPLFEKPQRGEDASPTFWTSAGLQTFSNVDPESRRTQFRLISGPKCFSIRTRTRSLEVFNCPFGCSLGIPT